MECLHDVFPLIWVIFHFHDYVMTGQPNPSKTYPPQKKLNPYFRGGGTFAVKV